MANGRGHTLIVLGLLVAISFTDGYHRVCYYTNWSQHRSGVGAFWPEDIDARLCSHLIYAFAVVTDNEIRTFESNDADLYKRFNDIKTDANGVKTLIAVGGWNAASHEFTTMVETYSSRQRFISSAIALMRQHGFDGLDLDWEYPAQRGGKPEDKANFVLLVKELTEAFSVEAEESGKPRLLLTAAVAGGKENIDTGYDVPELSKHLDFINLMTYDLHGSWESQTGLNAPLYPREAETGDGRILNVEWVANYWVSQGAPKEKLIIGMATYGRSFKLTDPAQFGVGADTSGAGVAGLFSGEAGMLSYYEICSMLDDDEVSSYWDSEQDVPYLVKGDMWVGYDNVESISKKTEWLVREGFGGAMVWTLALDDFNQTCSSSTSPYPLISAINAVLQHTSGATSTVLNVTNCFLLMGISWLASLLY